MVWSWTTVAGLVAAAALAVSPAAVRGEDCDPSKWKLPVDGAYDTQGSISPHKLNVHLVPHSHDDPYVMLSLWDAAWI